MITSCFFDVKGNNYKRNIVIFSINSASVLSFRSFALTLYNPQNEMFAHFQTKRIIFKNEMQLFKVIPIPQKSQKNRPASPEFYTFEGS